MYIAHDIITTRIYFNRNTSLEMIFLAPDVATIPLNIKYDFICQSPMCYTFLPDGTPTVRGM